MENQRGNVLMVMGFAIIPLTFATGMSVDYAQAMRLQTKLNAAADAASLAATSQTMMDDTVANAKARAIKMFKTQVDGTAGIIAIDYNDTAKFNVTVVDTTTATGRTRTATVTYSTDAKNNFAGILGMATLPVKGTSRALASTAPNIDFYLMLDVSQSMLLPATTSGLAAMRAATKAQAKDGCAFACHQTLRTDGEIASNPKAPDGLPMTNLMLARNLNITLRTDLVQDAVESLTQVAKTSSSNNKATYRMGLSAFDYDFRAIWPTTKNGTFWVDSDLDAVKAHAADATIRPYYKNNWRTSTLNDSDVGTASNKTFDSLMMNLPVFAGNGTKLATDSPQAIVFIITDGMRDEARPGSKPEGAFDTTKCDLIKARGIRIAVLYTEYLKESVYSTATNNGDAGKWSMDNVYKPYLSPTDKITPALQTCATAGLFYKVTTDDDISAALNKLFQAAVASSHLIR